MATTNKYLLCAVFALALAGCAADSDIAAGDDAGKAGKSKAYVTLSLSMDNVAPATRANPQGGEAGDGYERGQSYENVVSSAVAFFYRADGVNASPGTSIDGVAEFNRFTAGDGITTVDKIYTAEPQQVALDNGKYSVIVVANPGDDRWWNGTNLTLGDVRDHIYKEAWKEEVTKDDRGNDIYTYSDFLMASADNATLTITPDATQQDPAEVSANVERVAARIDYNSAKETFPLVDPAYAGGTVQITGAAIVNNLTAGSYLLKRVNTTASDNGVTYLGDETADANGVPTNYVIDPWTADKTELDNSFTIGEATGQPASALYGVWFGGQNSQPADPSQASELLTPAYWAALCTEGDQLASVDGGGTEGYRRIGYTLENTAAPAAAGPRYTTAVVFKARYVPNALPDYNEGQTFFAFGSRLFATLEDMFEAVCGVRPEEVFTNEWLNDHSTYGEIREKASAIPTTDPTGYRDHLLGVLEGHSDDESYKDEPDEDKFILNTIGWQSYTDILGYQATLGEEEGGSGYTIRIDIDEKDTRNMLRPYGVRVYKDAQCYYTWYVRHGNDNDDEAEGTMEHAIVRNNVYKLSVTDVYSLGGDIPGDEGLNVDVYVKDWTLLEQETLPM